MGELAWEGSYERVGEVMFINEMDCCGVVELVEIRTCKPWEVARFMQRHARIPLVIFTQAYHPEDNQPAYGDILKNYIVKHKLGAVTNSEARRNPNTGNWITVYTWSLNQDRIRKVKRKKHASKPR